MSSWPPRFLFHSGRLCLDFAQTGGEGRWKVFERLGTPADLADWLAASPLTLEVGTIRPRDLAAAHALRRSIWNAARSVARRRRLPPECLRRIEQVGARPDLVPCLKSGRLSWHDGSTVGQALSTIARDALRLFGSDLRDRLRECRNPRCPLLFVDRSRPGRRAWCAMRRCGNLSKTTRYRHRKRANAGASRRKDR